MLVVAAISLLDPDICLQD